MPPYQIIPNVKLPILLKKIYSLLVGYNPLIPKFAGDFAVLVPAQEGIQGDTILVPPCNFTQNYLFSIAPAFLNSL